MRPMATGPDIESLSRSELVEKARGLGVERPERMTRVELRDEMIRRTVAEGDQAEARGLFGVARSMLASVVESGLKFPDAAKVIRGDSTIQVPAANQTPVATVTLAEIYAAQGHQARALRMLEEVLREEPEHHEALRVRRELIGHDAPLPKAPESAPAPVQSPPQEAAPAPVQSPPQEAAPAPLQSPPQEAAPAPVQSPPQEAATSTPQPSAPSEPAATPDYVPGGFLDTTGEEIQTGKPPVVEVAESGGPEVDDVQVALAPHLVIAQEKSSLSLYWELPPSALAHCGVDTGDGGPAIRLVAFTPSGISPVRSERTLNIESAGGELGAGTRTLPEFGKPAVVRAALGWQSSDGFLPLSVGRSFEEWNESEEFSGLLERAESELEKSSPRA